MRNKTEGQQDQISIWDTENNKKLYTLPKADHIEDFVISPDDSTLAVFISDHDERVVLWNMKRGVFKQTLYKGSDWHQTNILSYTRDGQTLFLAQTGYAQLDKKGFFINNLTVHSWNTFTAVAASEMVISLTPDRQWALNEFLGLQYDLLAIYFPDNGIGQSEVELLDAKTGKKVATLLKPLDQTEKFSLPTGDAILAVFDDGHPSPSDTNFSVYDLKTGQQLYCFSTNKFNADGSRMAMVGSTIIGKRFILISDLHLVAETTPTVQP